MDKIQKALAKLYFALGEQNGQKPENANISAFMAEHLAFRAMHGTGESFGRRFFAMGAASAARAAAKPPKGKKAKLPGKLSSKPHGSKKKVKAPKKYDWEDFEEDYDDYD